MDGSAEALGARWRGDLEAWAIPAEIMAAAPVDPWGHVVSRFRRRTDSLVADPAGPTLERAREALGGGSVLDVGAGAGAVSLPLRPGELIAVDESAAMLAELSRRAAELGVRVQTIEGRWPDAAAVTPVADVVVCAHVVFNVPDLGDFFAALTAHARRRVVVELPERHPTSWLNPLWKHFHGLVRPTTPTSDDAAAIARALGHAVREERHLAPDHHYGSLEEMSAAACRRLCLAPSRAPEVARFARESGVWPLERTRWVTLWWDTAAVPNPA
jgi:SAM-dependent methyltransferase